MRRAVARGRSAALARSLNVIGCWLPPNRSSTRRPRSRLSMKSVAPRPAASPERFSFGMAHLQSVLQSVFASQPGVRQASADKIRLPKNQSTLKSPISSIGEQIDFHSKDSRHDEPGTERPDHPYRAEAALREADADVLAAGGAG